MTASIIIAVKTWQKNLEECVGKCRQLDFADFEIIILPDAVACGDVPAVFLNGRIKIIPTGPIPPPKKRDIGIAFACGDIVAFIDDDAYPPADWLASAAGEFLDPQTAAVAGPAVTPSDDSLPQKASGALYASWLVSAGYTYRYVPGPRRLVDDYPSCNLIVRKAVIEEAGGFQTDFWPGEDTKLCLAITQGQKKKIVYSPLVLLYHHRRAVFAPHLRQVAHYALHRGYFVKRFPQTSRKPAYCVPSLFVIVLTVSAAVSIVSAAFRFWFVCGLGFYCFVVLAASLDGRRHLGRGRRRYIEKIIFISMVFSGIILTHLVYGVYFIKGLVSPRLKEEQ